MLDSTRANADLNKLKPVLVDQDQKQIFREGVLLVVH